MRSSCLTSSITRRCMKWSSTTMPWRPCQTFCKVSQMDRTTYRMRPIINQNWPLSFVLWSRSLNRPGWMWGSSPTCGPLKLYSLRWCTAWTIQTGSTSWTTRPTFTMIESDTLPWETEWKSYWISPEITCSLRTKSIHSDWHTRRSWPSLKKV